MNERQREVMEAAARVLLLVGNYISTQDQNLLLSWDGGMKTWGELREECEFVGDAARDAAKAP